MIEIELPDGSVAEFPDGTPKEAIKGALQKRFQPQPQGRHLTYEQGLAELQKDEQSGIGGKLGAFMTGAVGDLPIVGPALLGGAQRAAAGLGSLMDGEDYQTNLAQAQDATQSAQQQNPGSKLAGGIAGNVGAFAGLGATGIGAKMLGMTGPSLLGRAGMSALSGGAISGADTAVRGGDASDVINNTAIGAGIGGAIPIVGAGLRKGAEAISDRVYPMINAIRNPTQEAQRRVGVAMARDVTATPGNTVTAFDDAIAKQTGIPIVNADRGGETTRALARSVANQSPESRSIIEKVASDRFGTQGARATAFIRNLTGGKADDLAYQEMLTKMARAANKPAYDAAYKSPQAQKVFTKRIQQLMQSPTFRDAIDDVPRRSADRGAIAGQKAVAMPFAKNSAGDYVIKRNADGSIVTPTLEFWDHVQRNLRRQYEVAVRSGDKTFASEVDALRKALNTDLDAAVPAFKSARQGAAAFFGAEDALEAGKKFAGTPRLVPEARKAFQSFKPAEKQAFSTGYASELIDRIKASGDRTNVINSVFKNQAARESMELVFGNYKSRQIEAYVRVEDLADRLRGAMGNSTTARQLVELGIGGGAGYAYSGDWTGALTGAALAKGARYVGQRADAKVMESVAKLLTSSNPQALQIAAQQAARNPAYMKAIETLSNALAAPARGIAATAQ